LIDVHLLAYVYDAVTALSICQSIRFAHCQRALHLRCG
jgi:hypothetical protein